jgi:hypothetical protein
MAEEMNMKGAGMNPLSAVPAEGRANLMKSSDSIRAVLMSRLANMAPNELQMLDSAITPEVARVLMKLLPELQELVGAVSSQRQGMQKRQAPQPAGGMPRNMGALGNM